MIGYGMLHANSDEWNIECHWHTYLFLLNLSITSFITYLTIKYIQKIVKPYKPTSMNYVQMYKWKWFFLQWILITTSDWWTAVINQMADWRFFSMETRLGGLYAAMGLRKKTPGLHVGSCDYLRKQKNLILFCSVCHVLILLPLQIYIYENKYLDQNTSCCVNAHLKINEICWKYWWQLTCSAYRSCREKPHMTQNIRILKTCTWKK